MVCILFHMYDSGGYFLVNASFVFHYCYLFKLRKECEVGHFRSSQLYSLFIAGDLDEKVGK